MDLEREKDHLENLQLKLNEFKKSKDFIQNHRTSFLQAEAEVLTKIDVSHMKAVLKLQRVLSLIQKIKEYD